MDKQDPLQLEVVTALTPLLARLQAIARTDPDVRAELARLGTALMAFAAEPRALVAPVEAGLQTPPSTTSTDLSSAVAPVEATTISQALPAATTDAPLATPPSTASQPPLPELPVASSPAAPSKPPKLAAPKTSTVTTAAKGRQRWVTTPVVQVQNKPQAQVTVGATFDLSALAQNCAIKQAGATWAALRQQRRDQGLKADLQVEWERKQLIQQAQALPDCYLWMCQWEAPPSATSAQFEQLAGCFGNAMHVTVLLHDLLQESEEQLSIIEEAMNLAAEAQAALQKAVAVVDKTSDSDQVRLHQWLKVMAARYHFKLHYMTKRNAADPATWPSLQTRIQMLATKRQQVTQSTKERKRLMGKVRHRCKVIQDHAGTPRLDDWQRLVVAVTELIETGLPPSNVELREALLPVIDDLPETVALSKHFHLVLREVDRFLANRTPTTPDEAATSSSAPIAAVQQARELLRGRAMVMIGGERRPSAADALLQAFALEELIWIEAYEHTAIDFEPPVSRPDVAVVVLAIRWVPHSYGDVKRVCEQYGKPLVRLPAGYNPNQVAHTMLNQVSQQLAAGQPREHDEG